MCQKENRVYTKKLWYAYSSFYSKHPINTDLNIFGSYPHSLYSLSSLLLGCECRMLLGNVTWDQHSLVLILSFASDFIFLSGSRKLTPARDTLPEMKIWILLIGWCEDKLMIIHCRQTDSHTLQTYGEYHTLAKWTRRHRNRNKHLTMHTRQWNIPLRLLPKRNFPRTSSVFLSVFWFLYMIQTWEKWLIYNYFSLERPAHAGEMGWQNLMRFSKGKCRILNLGRNNTQHEHGLRMTCLKADFHRRPWVPSGQQADDEPAMCPCRKEDQRHPGLH